MLGLVNEARGDSGIPEVRLGSNPAAQLHAEAALEGCYSSHWDQWGLKPNHRYTLSGGAGADGENASGSDYCIKSWDNYRVIGSMKTEVKEAMEGLMDSPGHRDNILDPAHTELNSGIAFDRYNNVIIQQFSSDYVTYEAKPKISSDGTLTMKGAITNAKLDTERTNHVQIYYDPPPKPLTAGQLSHTYSLCGSTKTSYLVDGAISYVGPDVTQQVKSINCIDPYETPADWPAPKSADEAHEAWATAKNQSEETREVTLQVRRLGAAKYRISEDAFDIEADLNQVLQKHGPGIYTVTLWGQPDHMKERTPISDQAIFWKTEPPADNLYSN